MKKLLVTLSILIFIAFTAPCFAQQQMLGVLARKNAAGCVYTCQETFTVGGDQTDVAANSMFDSEVDANSKLMIDADAGVSGGALSFYADTVNQFGYAIENSGCFAAGTEWTIKFQMYWTDIAGIDDGTSTSRIAGLYDGAAFSSSIYLKTGGTNLYSYAVSRGNDVETSADTVMTGIAADTWYDVVIYFKKDASTGGSSLKIGAWDAATTGFNDDTSALEIDSIRFGMFTHAFGDGTTDAYVLYDNLEIYNCDAR